MELQLLFLLLPIAALSGWLLGKGKRFPGKSNLSPTFQEDYFRGLNYLINEQPDKAIEVFVRMVEVDSETIDTHFALGSLFRRRGEGDRAIRIHQNIIARPNLSASQRTRAVYELARDHQSAGLFDRAESLYRELAQDREFGVLALHQLLGIYEQERDWRNAIEVAERLIASGDRSVESQLAHYYCELAEAVAAKGNLDEAFALLRRAPEAGDGAVRLCLLRGQFALALGECAEAIETLHRVVAKGPEFIPETVKPLREAYARCGRDAEWGPFLEGLVARHPYTSVVLAWCEEVRRHEGDAIAVQVLGEFLAKNPSIAGFERLIDLQAGNSPVEGFAAIKQLAHLLVQAKPRYRCGHCGFSGRTLYWHCPGCKRWGTTKPIYGIEGE